MSSRFFITLPDPSAARGSDPDFAFQAHGAEAFARELRDALTSPALFERWRARQDDPDAVDPHLGEIDPDADVRAHQKDLAIARSCASACAGLREAPGSCATWEKPEARARGRPGRPAAVPRDCVGDARTRDGKQEHMGDGWGSSID
jgi:hypothetical protein